MLAALNRRKRLRRLWGHHRLKTGLLLWILLLCFVLIGPVVYSVDPDSPDYGNKLKPPNAANLLGTDQAGRDQLARLMDWIL